MVNEGVEVVVVKKLRRKCAVWVSYCDLFGIFIGFHFGGLLAGIY
jgi:hypothetical protein